MTELFKSFFIDVLNDAGSALNDELLSQLDAILQIEQLPALSGILSTNVVEELYLYIYTFATALLILKFLFKGFSIYVLWRDGDADSSPQDMLTGTVQAIVVTVAFPYLYSVMADVTVQFTAGVMSLFGIASAGSMDSSSLAGLFGALAGGIAGGLWGLVILLIYLVLLVVLYVKLLGRGVELLVLRLGVPFAAMGLVDSDYGVWRSYIQIFWKTLFTCVVQLTLLSLSIPVVELGHFIIGIAIIAAAFRTPVILQQVLIPGRQGGGLTQKIYTGSMAVRAFQILRGG